MPLIVLLYVLAKKSVFGDEGVEMAEHKYEVKKFEVDNNITVEGQTSVLTELEGQFENVIEDNVKAIPAEDGVSFSGEESVQIENDQSNSGLVDANQLSENTFHNEAVKNELQPDSMSGPKEGNLRGFQSSIVLETREESSNAGAIDESNPKIDSLGNVAPETEQKSSLESPQVESLDNEEGSA